MLLKIREDELENTNIDKAVEKQKNFFNSNMTLEYQFRINSLNKLKNTILENEEKLYKALKQDLGKSKFEAYTCEISFVISEINHAIKNLKGWMKTKKVKTSMANLGGVSKIYKQPKGVCLIISPWNYPVLLTLSPLVAAIAAGNCVVIKPSEYSSNVSSLILELISENFAPEYICVITGDKEVSQQLLKQKFDHIFFTGSVGVGKIIMREASKNLTPVTLELGGKSPCIVHNDADIEKTARRIVWGKTINSGQTCVAPDYLLVQKDIKDKLVKQMEIECIKQFGENMIDNEDYPKIIHSSAFKRLLKLIENQKIITGGSSNAKTHKIELTLLDEPDFTSPVMQEEIFGPIFPIISYDTLEECKQIISQYEKPLALYIFTKSKDIKNDFIETIPFGGGCVNDVLMHLTNKNLPFGGIGESGMGSYHSKNGFEAFSHTKSILKNNFFLDFKSRYAPYKNKFDLVRKLM